MFKKNEFRLLYPFYLYYLIVGMTCVIIPFMVIYFRNIGLSFFQIGVLTSAMSLSMFIFELPTGAVADNLGRKKSVITGFGIAGLSLIAMGLFTNFWALLVCWVIAGFGMTFISGAEESWVIDNLNHQEHSHLQEEYYVKAQSLNALGFIFSPLLGSALLIVFPMNTLWYVWGMGFFLSGAILLIFGKESYVPKKTRFLKFFSATLKSVKSSMGLIKKNKELQLIFLGSFFLYVMVMAQDGIQPVLTSLGLEVKGLGVYYSIMGVVLMVCPFLMKFFKKMSVKKGMIITTLIRMGALFSLVWVYPPLFLVAGILLLTNEGLAILRFPLLQPYLHKQVPKKIRATITSVQSMINQASIGLASIAGGWLMDIFGPKSVIAYSSLFGFAAIFFFMKFKE